MSSRAMNVVNKGLPWRSDVSWTVVAAEAIALVGVGIYMLVAPDSAADAVLQIVGLVFLVASVVLGAAVFRESEVRLGAFDAFRAGIGVTVGLIATISWWSDYIDRGAVRVILGWGLVTYSVLHLVGLIAIRGREALRLSTLVIVALTLVLGVVLLTSTDTVSDGRIRLLGSIFVVFGALLGALAWYLYSRASGHQGPTNH